MKLKKCFVVWGYLSNPIKGVARIRIETFAEKKTANKFLKRPWSDLSEYHLFEIIKSYGNEDRRHE